MIDLVGRLDIYILSLCFYIINFYILVYHKRGSFTYRKLCLGAESIRIQSFNLLLLEVRLHFPKLLHFNLIISTPNPSDMNELVEVSRTSNGIVTPSKILPSLECC